MYKFHRKVIFGAAVFGVLSLVGGAAAVYGQGEGSNMPAASVQARLAELAQVKSQHVCGTPGGDAVRCDARVVVGPSGAPKANAKLPSGYGPQQFVTAYDLNGGIAAGNPIIAIVDAYDDPNIARDLNTYSNTFKIPALAACSGSIRTASGPCFQKMNQNGGTASFPRSDSGWALEISLDVETAHASCQNCKILLVEATTANYSDLLTAIDTAVANGATVVSNSWGSSEFSGENAFDAHFNKPGAAFTFSSGDSGYGAQYPAASPLVTAVGGTTLLLNSNNSYLSEAAWNGTGSGCSAYEPQQPWQASLHLPGCANRIVADVAADADPATGAAVYDSVRYYGQAGWFQVGGTSLSSPLIAAVYALRGVPSGAAANALPYNMPGALHDVNSGSNGSCGGTYLCTAISGYDGPTGLGTPNGTAAF